MISEASHPRTTRVAASFRMRGTLVASCLCMQVFSDVFPHLVTATDCPKLVKIGDVDFSKVDAIFCCLPHATTQVSA